SPFFVNTELRPWERANGVPRRAGVTSLGMGDTNAHVVLEEAPERAPSGPSRPWQILVLSGRTETAADAAVERLAAYLEAPPEGLPAAPLPDVAYTLQVGRKALAHRRVLLCRGDEEAVHEVLARRDPERLLRGFHRGGDRPVAFLFPGQGAQYSGMGRGLYEAEASFREDLDRCAELLAPRLGRDLREVLFPADGPEARAAADARLRRTALAQPALFAVSWATARLWMRWGVVPDALLGHSLGEYAAACLAGVFSLEDALALVAARGALMQQMPPGAMVGVPLPEEEVRELLAEEWGEDLGVAAVNRPRVSVVSGPSEAVDELVARLEARGVSARRLHTSHAFHSKMMDPIVPAFVEEVKGTRLEPPRIAYLSNVTGTWIRPEEATDPAYWGRQLRGAVRFASGVAELLAEPQRILVEAGPGNTLSTLARQHPDRRPSHAVVSSLRHPKEERDDQATLLEALGRVWLAGGAVDWAAFQAGEDRRRVPLPTYPFERQRYWVDPLPEAEAGRKRLARGRRSDPAEWFHAPVWRRAPLPLSSPSLPEAAGSALVVGDRGPLAEALVRRLEAAGRAVAVAGLDEVEGFGPLLDALPEPPGLVLHLGAVTGGRELPDEELLARSYHSFVTLAAAVGERCGGGTAILAAVSDGLHEVTGGETVEPLKATLLGACGTIPREYPGLACRSLDVEPAADRDPEVADRLARAVLRELAAAPAGEAGGFAPPVALRGRHRWVRSVEPLPLGPVAPGALPLAAGTAAPSAAVGAYLVTGGLGGIGLELAGCLAREAAARETGIGLVLVGRSPFPPPEDWDAWLAAHEANGGRADEVAGKIARLRELEALGARVLTVAADVASEDDLRAVARAAEERWGPELGRVRGIVHAAGVPGGALLSGRRREDAERVLAPKVRGALALERVFGGSARRSGLDFFVLCSSVTGLLPEMGQADYAAANCFLDAFA
ncbi:MAG TPA: type I polyketide synthase, partial [Thermoanaerobaculia bacterium]